MTEEENEFIKKHLRKADRVIKVGIIALVFCSALLTLHTWYPSALKSSSSPVDSVPIISELVDDKYFGMDSLDIKDGIHLPSGLIVDKGIQEVSTTCSACHTIQLVTQNRATKDGWKELIVWMQKTQKLWDLGDSEPIILNYLSKNYAPENSGRRKNLENIEWYELN